MSERLPDLLIQDMLQAINSVFSFSAHQTMEDFLNDDKTRSAVAKKLEIVGEAANRLPKEFRDMHPEIEWGKVIRTRHILVHEYAEVDYEIIWRIITVHLPPLHSTLESVHKSLKRT